jgi:transcriptional regulator with XRE-family HTH domain
MNNPLNASKLLKEARKRADITQRELAKRSGKAQSAIARIESGKSSPTLATLNHLLEAAGFEADVILTIKPVEDSHILDDVSRILQMSPEERLMEVANINRFEKEVKNG